MLKIGIINKSLNKIIAIKSRYRKFTLKDFYKPKKNIYKFSSDNIVFESINFLFLKFIFLYYFFLFCGNKYSKSSLSVFSF